VIERYAHRPTVIGFQVDNEPGPHLLHNRGIFQRVVNQLREQYGDVQSLNEEWGLVHWSHLLTDWADLWTPDGNAQPQYEQAWRRSQADLVTAIIAWQADSDCAASVRRHTCQRLMCRVARAHSAKPRSRSRPGSGRAV
jgi:beta-galactosidase